LRSIRLTTKLVSFAAACAVVLSFVVVAEKDPSGQEISNISSSHVSRVVASNVSDGGSVNQAGTGADEIKEISAIDSQNNQLVAATGDTKSLCEYYQGKLEWLSVQMKERGEDSQSQWENQHWRDYKLKIKEHC